MRKTIFLLMTLVSCMSMNAQVIKVCKGTEVVATYTPSEADNVIFEGSPNVASITLNRTTATVFKGSTMTLTATVLPETAEDKSVSWSSSNETVAIVSSTGTVAAIAKGTATITATANDGSGVSASCVVTVSDDPSGSHEYVDLGLESGTLWATCNVGAEKPDDYGLYFAWGETTGYTSDTSDGRSFNWANYKWMTEGQSSWKQINKYTFADNQTSAIWYSNGTFVGDGNTKLSSEDDAATVNWGSNWCMPTHAQMQELVNGTTSSWTTENGVYGYKFVSKKDATKYIFLPAAGYRYATYLYDAGSSGSFWSSELYSLDSSSAWTLYFYSGGVSAGSRSSRYCGQSVRPVRASALKN